MNNKFNFFSERSAINNGRYAYILKRLNNLGIKPPLKVIDCACGNGLGSKVFKDNKYEVTSVDNDHVTINKLIEENFNVIKASIENLPFENNLFDIFISSETLEHVEKKQLGKAIREIKRVTKKNGIIAITVPENKKICLENPYHKQYLSYWRLRIMFFLPVLFKGRFCKTKDRCNTVIIYRNSKMFK